MLSFACCAHTPQRTMGKKGKGLTFAAARMHGDWRLVALGAARNVSPLFIVIGRARAPRGPSWSSLGGEGSIAPTSATPIVSSSAGPAPRFLPCRSEIQPETCSCSDVLVKGYTALSFYTVLLLYTSILWRSSLSYIPTVALYQYQD
jgi:hypothetical protein